MAQIKQGTVLILRRIWATSRLAGISDQSSRVLAVRSAAAGASGPAGIVSELVLIGVVLIAAGVLFSQGVAIPADYDEGSYLSAVDALRHGQELGKDVFTPQPPAFYVLLRAGNAVRDHSVDAVRAEILALALLGCVGAYLTGRLVAGRLAGLGAAALLAVSHPYSTFAGKISADLPAVAIGLFALAALAVARKVRNERTAVALAGASGALFVFSALVKLSLLSLAVPLVFLALLRPRVSWRRAAAAGAGGAAVLLAFVIAYHAGLHGIWRGAVSYHSAARDVTGPGTSIGDNVRHYLHFFDPRARNPLSWIGALGLLAWLALPQYLRLRLAPLWLWAAIALLFNVTHKPLHDNHDVLIAGALGLAAGVSAGAALERVPRRQALVGAAAVTAVLTMGYVKQFLDLHRAHAPEPAEVTWSANELRARTHAGDLVATDRPIIAFLAHRTMPGDLVDTAYLRFRSGYLTPAEVLADIDRARVWAVVADRAFRDQPVILAGLRRRYRTVLRHDGALFYFNRRSSPSPASGR
jgi:4-amino-4-deoxy-L-arabinose transferase-like glycosyltransferase